MYDEPGAPAGHLDSINGVTLCFRVTPVASPRVEPLPDGVPDVPLRVPTSITTYPCGDLNMNPLPIMQGMEFHRLGDIEGRRACTQRVHQYWHWMQSEKGFDRYRIQRLFPFTGVREGPRLIGRRVLTENDIVLGCSGQTDADRWITIADHAVDVHGEGHRCHECREPYGVPYDCLLPREFDNVAVACRGASFSHIAASSCRLSRTIMQLGHAAGLAAALAARTGCALPDVPVANLQAWLAEDDVSLDPADDRWPAVVGVIGNQ
jgi:hypothetical protein